MATKVASLYADVNANISGFMGGMSTVKGTLSGVASSLSSFTNTAVAAFAGAAAGAIVFQKALEFGDAGAQIMQTRDSFNALATSLGQGPGLLQELQTATRGTVSELDLMASTNQLLAGTTGDLGRQLADAAPQLARIAQAAHDLNPTMGTTAEMYDRLSRGIKKAEPELLDEVGILMNLTQVYKQYADAHGITVTAMDKTMKTEAMLNAVLSQGNTLIQQAGKVSNDAATSIDRMQASLENAGNAAKATFAPAIAQAADAVYYLLTANKSIMGALTEHEQQVRGTAASYEDYVTETNRAANAAGYLINSYGDLIDGQGRLVVQNYQVGRSLFDLGRSLQANSTAVNGFSNGLSVAFANANVFSNGMSIAGANLTTFGTALDTSTESVYNQEAAMAAYGDRLTATAAYYAELEAAEQQRIMTAGLMAGIQGQLGDATASYSATLAELTVQETELTTALVDAQMRGYAPTSEKILELNEALAQNKEAQVSALDSLQNLTAEMIYQQAAAGLDTQAALDLARGMGILSEQDYVVATSIETLRGQFDTNRDSMISAAEGAGEFASQTLAITRAAQSLQAKNLPITFENLTKELEAMSQTDAASEMEDLGASADPASQGMEDVAGAAGDAAGSLADSASASEDQSAALQNIGASAGRAASGIGSAGSAARAATGPLAGAAAAADRLAGALQSIPGRTNISVSISGVDAAIAAIGRLNSAIASIDTSIDININTTTTSSGGGGPPPPGPRDVSQTPSSGNAPVALYETYNVYNPLAAAMLVQQKKAATVQRLEAVMNG